MTRCVLPRTPHSDEDGQTPKGGRPARPRLSTNPQLSGFQHNDSTVEGREHGLVLRASTRARGGSEPTHTRGSCTP